MKTYFSDSDISFSFAAKIQRQFEPWIEAETSIFSSLGNVFTTGGPRSSLDLRMHADYMCSLGGTGE